MEKGSKTVKILNIICIAFLILTLAAIVFGFPNQNLYIEALIIVSFLVGAFTSKKNGQLKNSFWYYITTNLILLVLVITVSWLHVPHATTISIFIIIIVITINYFFSKIDRQEKRKTSSQK